MNKSNIIDKAEKAVPYFTAFSALYCIWVGMRAAKLNGYKEGVNQILDATNELSEMHNWDIRCKLVTDGLYKWRLEKISTESKDGLSK